MERERRCLDDDSIGRFHSGRLDSDARSSIEHHVDTCPTCALLILPSGSRPFAHRLAGAQALAPGERVAGRYRIERLVGGGAMGEVYSALDEQLGERVALKTVRATIADNAGAIARLKSEVQLARRVTHPNVCRIYDLGTGSTGSGRASNVAFLTMELLPGRTLAEAIRRRGAFPNETASKVMRHLVAGLAAAHRAGVIHKDFKSDNVILVAAADGVDGSEAFERAVITDFGLAAPQALTIPDDDNRLEVSGTPGYIAPERLRGATATPASDVYSLGVVFLDMLEGRVPARPSAAANAATSSLDLRGIALSCCHENPEARPGVGALATMLVELERRPLRRSSRAARLVGVSAMVAAGVGAIWLQPRPGPYTRAAAPLALPVIAKVPPRPPALALAPEAIRAPPVLPPPRKVLPRRRPVDAQRWAVSDAVGAPTPAAPTELAASPARADEPIRVLEASPRKTAAVTLEAKDDALIDPFAGHR